MSLGLDFVPRLPFEGFKWKWASLQCTEGINDPVVLLGVLSRMRKLEKLNSGLTYSSEDFAEELNALAADVAGRGIDVDLAGRTGSRNLIRNSGQYWRALGLIPEGGRGVIRLTPFGRQIADGEVSQPEFAAITVSTFTLPNRFVQGEAECDKWRRAGLVIHPLALLLKIVRALRQAWMDPYLTREELVKIVIPLSGTKGVEISDYVNFIQAYRGYNLNVSKWPDCTPSANDGRIAREFLLFLSYYGYLVRDETSGEERFVFNDLIETEVENILERSEDFSFLEEINRLKRLHVGEEVERKRILRSQRGRPNQQRFRREVLGDEPRCVISNVTMPEVLIAAHIIPFRYKGADDKTNGFCMRSDIHILYDANELRILPTGKVELSQRARLSYGATIPPSIVIPPCVSLENLRWRCDNYRGF